MVAAGFATADGMNAATLPTDGPLLDASNESTDRLLPLQRGILQALDAHAIVAVTDRRGRIIHANRLFCEISGYSEAELLGQDHRLLNSGLHSRQFMQQMWRTIARGGTWDGEFCNRRRDGRLYWVQSTIVPIPGADGKPEVYVSVRTDVSRLKRTESELEASEARFRRLFERSADALLLLDVELGRFIDCNDAAARMLGLEARDAAIGLAPAALSPLHQPDGRLSADKATAMISEALRSGSHRFEWWHCSPQRLPFPVDVSLTSVVHDGRQLVLTTWRDDTDRQSAEEWRDHYTMVLGRLVDDDAPDALLDAILRFIEHRAPGVRLAAHALSSDGHQVLATAAPGLPDAVRHGVARCPHADCQQLCPLLSGAADPGTRSGCGESPCPALAAPAGLVPVRVEQIRASDRSLLGALLVFVDNGQAVDADAELLIRRSMPLLALVVERARVRRQQQFADVIFHESSEAIVLTDPMDRVLTVNRAFETLLGRGAGEALNQPLHRLLHAANDEACQLDIERGIAERGRWHGEVLAQHRSGRTVPLLCSITEVLGSGDGVAHRLHVLTDLTDSKQQSARIDRLAHYDELTQLPNRTLLQLRLGDALLRAAAQHSQLSLLCIDLDRFKEVNDSRGHSAGDRALAEVAARFRQLIADRHLLARTGGDEFAVIIEHGSGDQAEALARDLQQALQTPLLTGEAAFTLGASIGIATFPADGSSSEDLLRQADIAMYRAKSEGGGFCFYRASMGQTLNRQLDIATRLLEALAAQRLQLHYQPLVDLRNGQLAGAEALLRWHDPVEGWISPAEFIPIAEARGMMAVIGDWLFAAVCRQLREWLDDGVPLPPRIAINLSAQQLAQTDLISRLQEALDHARIDARSLELELTESSVVVDPERAIAQMTALTDLGFSLSIDDFGTGYSSLSYLKRFPAHKLKIDMSFVRDMLVDRNDFAIVETIIAMARTLRLQTVAEGVESVEQADALAALGCDCAQGYHFGRAMPAQDFRRRWLESEADAALAGEPEERAPA